MHTRSRAIGHSRNALSERRKGAIPRSGLDGSVGRTAVAVGLGMKRRDLMSAGRQRTESRARLIAACLGRAIGGVTVSRTAKYFGREGSTFSRGVLRLEEKLRTDANVRRHVARTEALQA